ncbi:probable protein arginine N-methyltransferase 1.2 isoform X2 [Fopius arisanus]|nr:PREDICTED: probable protein arginine N-methyltransferase 1.2 isoform X2 [Fopius arisanus]
MTAYKNAIMNNKDLFAGKVVMDVGAGTGILSIFCAQIGAKIVYAVEPTRLSSLIGNIAAENGVGHIVKVIPKKLENIRDGTVEVVDVIISEWMGFYLVHEGMLDTIITARDRFLVTNGLIFPCIAKLYAAPCQIPEFFEFWNDVCGVKMETVGYKFRESKCTIPEIMIVKPENLLSDGKLVASLDLTSVTINDLSTIGGRDLVFPANKSGKLQGICVWFDVEFPNSSQLSTSPRREPTHWKQTVILLPCCMEFDKSEPIALKITVRRDKRKPRWYRLEAEILNPEETEHELPCDCWLIKCIVTKKFILETGSY